MKDSLENLIIEKLSNVLYNNHLKRSNETNQYDSKKIYKPYILYKKRIIKKIK